MFYWFLHKPLTQSDLNNQVEGYPFYMYERFSNIVFVDITNYSLCERFEYGKKNCSYQDIYDIKNFKNRYIRIRKRFDLQNFLKTVCKDDTFLFQDFGRINVKLVVQELNKKGIEPILLNYWRIPSFPNPIIKQKKNLSYLFLLRKTLFKKIVYKLTMRKLKETLHFSSVFSCGNKYNEELSKIAVWNNLIPCHSLPYDEFLYCKNSNSESCLKEPYIVFVDQALPIHPDNANYFSEDFSESYHTDILKALRFIKEKFRMNIIIAQHPRIQFPNGYWEEFETRSGETNKLIFYSALVIGHFSTAMFNAYFLQKPNIFLTSSNKDFPFAYQVEKYYKLLGNKLLDMSSLELKEKKSNRELDIKDYFSLIPEKTFLQNKKILTDFIAQTQ